MLCCCSAGTQLYQQLGYSVCHAIRNVLLLLLHVCVITMTNTCNVDGENCVTLVQSSMISYAALRCLILSLTNETQALICVREHNSYCLDK